MFLITPAALSALVTGWLPVIVSSAIAIGTAGLTVYNAIRGAAHSAQIKANTDALKGHDDTIKAILRDSPSPVAAQVAVPLSVPPVIERIPSP